MISWDIPCKLRGHGYPVKGFIKDLRRTLMRSLRGFRITLFSLLDVACSVDPKTVFSGDGDFRGVHGGFLGFEVTFWYRKSEMVGMDSNPLCPELYNCLFIIGTLDETFNLCNRCANK